MSEGIALRPEQERGRWLDERYVSPFGYRDDDGVVHDLTNTDGMCLLAYAEFRKEHCEPWTNFVDWFLNSFLTQGIEHGEFNDGAQSGASEPAIIGVREGDAPAEDYGIGDPGAA